MLEVLTSYGVISVVDYPSLQLVLNACPPYLQLFLVIRSLVVHYHAYLMPLFLLSMMQIWNWEHGYVNIIAFFFCHIDVLEKQVSQPKKKYSTICYKHEMLNKWFIVET